MATTNYEIAKERRKFYHRDSEASGSRSNLESESRSKRHDNKKASSSCRPTTRLTHRADNDTKVVEHVIVSESNEEDDDDSNEDADRLESERIMVPYGEYLTGTEIMTSCFVLNFVYYHGARASRKIEPLDDFGFVFQIRPSGIPATSPRGSRGAAGHSS